MSECVVRMEMPHVCITENGYYGYCPMDRVWCIQRNAPPDITMREAYEAMTDKIPSWCPIICSLPEGHGRLGDLDELKNWLVAQIDHYKRFEYGAICSTMVSAYETVCKVIDSMTVIVPAERSET